MRQSRTFIPTTREVPSSAEAISHKLLIKAGMVKQVSAGVYTYPVSYTHLNFVFADNQGNIAYKSNGNVPIRKKGNGNLPVPGYSSEYGLSLIHI